MITIKFTLLMLTLSAYTHALPRRFRRGDDQVTYGPCKNTYDQCGDWQIQGWCTSNAYKDYMATVCPVTCNFCSDSPTAKVTEENSPTADSKPDTTTPSDSSAPSSETNDEIQAEYQAKLQKYYADIQQEQAAYVQQNLQNSTTDSTPAVSNTPRSTDSLQAPETSSADAASQSSAVAQPSNYAAPTSVETAPAAPAALASTPTDTSTAPQAPASSDPSYTAAASSASTPTDSQASQTSQTSQTSSPDPAQSNAGTSSAGAASAPPSSIAAVLLPQLILGQHPTNQSYNPKHTSSALYNNTGNANHENKMDQLDDATNEKIKTESKHLEKTLAKAKHVRLEAAKKIKLNKGNSTEADDSEEDKSENEESATLFEKGKAHSALKAFTKVNKNSNHNKTTKAFSGSSSNKLHSASVGKTKKKSVTKSASKSLKPKRKVSKDKKTTRSEEPVADDIMRSFETEASLLGTGDGDADESGSGSGSGSNGNSLDGFEESSLINGPQFYQDDYDVMDDLSNELTSLKAASKFVRTNEDDAVLSYTGKNTARSEIDVPEEILNPRVETDDEEDIDVSDINEESENDYDDDYNAQKKDETAENEDNAEEANESGSGSGDSSEDASVKKFSMVKPTDAALIIAAKKSAEGSGYVAKKSAEGSGYASVKKFSMVKPTDAALIIAAKKSAEGSGYNSVKKSTTSDAHAAGDTDDAATDAESGSGSGESNVASEDGEEADEEDEHEVGETRTPSSSKSKKGGKTAEDFLPDDLLPATEEERKQNEEEQFKTEPNGKISIVIKQNFNELYKDPKSTNYKMLAGNIKQDISKALKGAKANKISFSEATIEGNPRQRGKTKVTFNLKSKNKNIYEKLIDLVDAGNINGLAVVKSSAETDD